MLAIKRAASLLMLTGKCCYVTEVQRAPKIHECRAQRRRSAQAIR